LLFGIGPPRGVRRSSPPYYKRGLAGVERRWRSGPRSKPARRPSWCDRPRECPGPGSSDWLRFLHEVFLSRWCIHLSETHARVIKKQCAQVYSKNDW